MVTAMLVVYRGKITKMCHCEPVTVCAALSAFLLLLLPLWPTLPCPPSFLFAAFPPSVANSSTVRSVPACSVGTHTHTYAVLVRCCQSIRWPSSIQSESRLLDQRNVCLCRLIQSEWWLMLVPVSSCCCYEFSLLPAWEEVCLFFVRGGTLINSALYAFILNTHLITENRYCNQAGCKAEWASEGCCGLSWQTALESKQRILFCVWWRRGREEGAWTLTSAELVVCCWEERKAENSRGRKRGRNLVSGYMVWWETCTRFKAACPMEQEIQ